MALRADYYESCIREINRKLDLLENLKDEIISHDIEADFGIENCAKDLEIEDNLKQISNTIDDMCDSLMRSKRKLITDVSEVY